MNRAVRKFDSNPLLSIIVPVYNVELYVSKCIESILSQEFENFELILVNDGSTDASLSVCQKYAALDKRIKIITQNNMGLSGARNTGLANIKGNFVGFVDSDDWIEATMYNNLISSCIEESADIACCGRKLVYSATSIKELLAATSRSVWTAKEGLARLFTWDGIDSSACDKVFRARLFADVRYPEGALHEDIMVMYRLISCATTIAHTGTCEYNYRQRPGSITRSKFDTRKMNLLSTLYEIDSFIRDNYPSIQPECSVFGLVNTDVIIYSLVSSKNGKGHFADEYSLLKQGQSYFAKSALDSKKMSLRELVKYKLSKCGLEKIYLVIKTVGLKWRFRHGS
ncbi:MAG: glycosyltransferase [Bacteroidaceae bacterium]